MRSITSRRGTHAAAHWQLEGAAEAEGTAEAAATLEGTSGATDTDCVTRAHWQALPRDAVQAAF